MPRGASPCGGWVEAPAMRPIWPSMSICMRSSSSKLDSPASGRPCRGTLDGLAGRGRDAPATRSSGDRARLRRMSSMATRPHLVLEHLEGPRLSSLIRRYGPLPPEQLVPLATQLCSALHYLAAEGVVHLDVKPANTIMAAPPRLIDLSVAMPLAAARALERSSGHRRLHGPGAVRPGRARAGWSRRRRLRARRDAVPGRHR